MCALNPGVALQFPLLSRHKLKILPQLKPLPPLKLLFVFGGQELFITMITVKYFSYFNMPFPLIIVNSYNQL